MVSTVLIVFLVVLVVFVLLAFIGYLIDSHTSRKRDAFGNRVEGVSVRGDLDRSFASSQRRATTNPAVSRPAISDFKPPRFAPPHQPVNKRRTADDYPSLIEQSIDVGLDLYRRYDSGGDNGSCHSGGGGFDGGSSCDSGGGGFGGGSCGGD